jgi:hypothetical protein
MRISPGTGRAVEETVAEEETAVAEAVAEEETATAVAEEVTAKAGAATAVAEATGLEMAVAEETGLEITAEAAVAAAEVTGPLMNPRPVTARQARRHPTTRVGRSTSNGPAPSAATSPNYSPATPT